MISRSKFNWMTVLLTQFVPLHNTVDNPVEKYWMSATGIMYSLIDGKKLHRYHINVKVMDSRGMILLDKDNEKIMYITYAN